jgi:CHASE2 domain-containing sensor protein
MTDSGEQGPAPEPDRRSGRGFLSRLLAERHRTAISFTTGLLVLLLVQLPAVEQSFLGAPDREMIELAFKLRADVIAGVANPVLFLDFDDRTLGSLAAKPFSPPPIATPRGMIAELLNFIRAAPPDQAPRVVIVDVDIGQSNAVVDVVKAVKIASAAAGRQPAAAPDAMAIDPGVAALQSALAQWAASPTAPPLIIARQSFPARILGVDAPGLALPETPYDDVVARAPNIYWGLVKVLSDQNGVVREFAPFECVVTSHGREPLFSAALLAYQFDERNPKVLANAPARHWIADAQAQCQSKSASPVTRGERIDFHISMDTGYEGRVWPDLSPRWPGFSQCRGADSTIFRRLSVMDIHNALAAGADLSHALLCQHVVIIGGTNASDSDFVQTPLNEMQGSVVLANAIRGLELTGGGMHAIPLLFQVLMLALISIAMTATTVVTTDARRGYHGLQRIHKNRRLHHWLGILTLNPLILNGMIALSAHVLGVLLLAVSLNFGLWGFLSAPVFAAAITETVQEFQDG